MDPIVTITQRGRLGHVTYQEGTNAIVGYQEFGGGDVVAIVSMGSVDDWRERHTWAVERRAEILRFVADELIRQAAPSCTATIDDVRGDILFRTSGAAVTSNPRHAAPAAVSTPAPRSGDGAWVFRYGTLRGWMGVTVLAVALVVGAAAWVKTRFFVVQPGKGVPFGRTIRIDTHLATLIDQLQPYTPSLHHDPSKERRTLSLFLVPLDGSTPKLVTLLRDLRPGSYSLARIIGSDGRLMWIAATALVGVDLRTHKLVTEDDVQRANPGLDPQLVSDTRGMDIVDGRLRLLSRDQREAWALDPDTLKAVAVPPRPVVRPLPDPPLTMLMAPATGDYRDPSFLRLNEKSEPLRVDPDSRLMLHTSGSGPSRVGTLLVSRVRVDSGSPLWTADTGIDRFTLKQILPSEGSTAFVGTRPPVPSKVSEPLIVIVDHATGRLTSHSLWQ